MNKSKEMKKKKSTCSRADLVRWKGNEQFSFIKFV